MALIKTPDGGFYLDDSQFAVDYEANVVTIVGGGPGPDPGSGYLPLTGGEMEGPLILQDGSPAVSEAGVQQTVDQSVQEAMAGIAIATESQPGTVLSSLVENQINVTPQGVMEVNSVNLSKIVQTPGDDLYLQSGNSVFA